MATKILKYDLFRGGHCSLVTPVHACSHMGTAKEKFKKSEFNNIATGSIVRIATVSPQIVSPELGEAMSANPAELGTCLPQKTWLKRGTNGTPSQAFIQDFFSDGVGCS